ncbi:MAG: DNA-3-methyladenine glycosylase I [bacterium]
MPIAPEALKLEGRCPWPRNELDLAYHDREWGVPVHDDRLLFEMLCLEGAQAGLSWATILAKRENYRRAFAGFAMEKVAAFTEADVRRLVGDAGIVRHEGKIRSVIGNAQACIDLQRQHGSLDAYLWRFVGGSPILRRPRSMAEVPTSTAHSDAMSAALKRAGVQFGGSPICSAFMQAVGMVNDHVASCPCGPDSAGGRGK